MAAGRVLTGFSLPYVAKYTVSSGTPTYSSGQKLARGVDVSIAPDTSDSNNFYADNQLAESAGGIFTGGTVSLTVDGLLDPAERLIYGLPAKDGSGFYNYDDDAKVPYVGLGFVARYMSDGVTSYVPYALPKVKFNYHDVEAATQEEDIDWQTQSLEATIFRADDSKHTWKKMGEAQTTEASAEAKIKTLFSIS